jgi:metallo-beta-lactamase family protein
MKITFHGAARTVTGSQHLLEVNGRQILLDCGLYQGKRQDAYERNKTLPFDVSRVDVMILSHAHIDHSGNIPNLVKSGFKGDIYATYATRDLAAMMLLDSAHIQENDVEFVNKRRHRKGEPPIEPLYTQPDATASLNSFHAVAYDRSTQVLPGVLLTFVDAGHMLGSSIVILNIEDRDQNRELTLVFSGDLGQPGLPILRDPTLIDRADILLCESTYGDRLHAEYKDSERDLARIVNETYKRGGKLIIPAFAVGRTQEIVYALHKLSSASKIPHLPIYVDSPLATNVTSVFSEHPEAYDEETRQFISGNSANKNLFGFADMHYTRSVEESKALNFLREPAIIISASGMAEAGRIQHHLANNIEDAKNTILIAGYQAENTLGRYIQEKQKTVRIFGEMYNLHAQVEVLTGFSAHADRNGLLHWAGAIKKKPLRTFLVHGEDSGLNGLSQGLREELGFERVEIPNLHQTFNV